MVAPIGRSLVTPAVSPAVFIAPDTSPGPQPTDGFTPMQAAKVIDPNAAVLLNLRRGNTGARVTQLQKALITAGYLPSNFAFGPFGPQTEAALKRFQTDHGLGPSGVVDANTVKALLGEPIPLPQAVPNAAALAGLKYGATDSRLVTLHGALVARGYLPANFTSNTSFGKRFGELTLAAVQQLQRDFGLVPTGVIDAATARVLGSTGFPPGRTFKGTWSSYPELGAALGPVERSSNGTQSQRFAGGTMTMSPTGALSVTSTTGVSLGAQQLGTVDTVAEANARYFVNQEGNTPWFQSFNTLKKPFGANDCGPTSVLMALSALGLAAHPDAQAAPYAIDAVRDAILGASNWSTKMGFDNLKRGIEAFGGAATTLSLAGVNKQGAGLGAVDAALARGNPVILGGVPGNAWAKALGAANYLDMGNGNATFNHFVAVLGRTSDGKYIVGDPLSSKGALEVTAAQLGTFLTQGTWRGALEVSRPV
ncbi:MAG: peptidoglycan-binding protein [Myxococcaceae bacterium]|nr:peptidoglycan-binding protein [Myxococcaceae bacterium]